MALPRSEYLSSVWKENIFAGRVTFVTGGAGTICSAQTRALVHLGADACILGRNTEKTEAAARSIATARPGAKVLGIGGCDVRDAESLSRAVERCVCELGAIDFVIAGAAGNFISPIAGLSSNAFRSVMEIDVLGTFNTIKATLPYLVESAKRNKSPSSQINGLTGGRIIFVSATFHYTGMPLQSHVSAAKAGVDSLMASVALEYGPHGITSNTISPGPIANTEGMARLSNNNVSDRDRAAAVPLGRWGSVRDIADATVYLFSDAGNFVNGEMLVVDGASWRINNGGVGLDPGMRYPDFLLTGEFSKTVKSGKKEKAKL